jgi:molybdopterin-guanine dinucleotide biosynthesis protein A
MTYAGIVLAGGAGRRLGGVAKPSITIGDRRLLDIVIEALVGAEAIVAVGPRVPTARPVTWARESPPGGGPVAALATALAVVSVAEVVVLAADLPFVTAGAVGQLVDARLSAPAAIAVDAEGRDQPLLASYDTGLLRRAIPRDNSNAAMRDVVRALAAHGALRRIDLGGDPPVTWDCDTPIDLSRAEELA